MWIRHRSRPRDICPFRVMRIEPPLREAEFCSTVLVTQFEMMNHDDPAQAFKYKIHAPYNAPASRHLSRLLYSGPRSVSGSMIIPHRIQKEKLR
jgi:hypothetical protein